MTSNYDSKKIEKYFYIAFIFIVVYYYYSFTMTSVYDTKYIEDALTQIKNNYADPEAQHQIEDSTYIKFLFDLKDSKFSTLEEAKKAAELVLQIRDMTFPRWYA